MRPIGYWCSTCTILEVDDTIQIFLGLNGKSAICGMTIGTVPAAGDWIAQIVKDNIFHVLGGRLYQENPKKCKKITSIAVILVRTVPFDIIVVSAGER